MTPELEARGLAHSFPRRRGLAGHPIGTVEAVAGVDLTLVRGETYALVGESGSGKTTLGRCLLRLIEPSRGSVRFQGEDLLALGPKALRRRRRDLQMIFQDPVGSLNPRHRVGRIVEEPLRAHRLGDRVERRARVESLLERVGIDAPLRDRFPHQLSGGQRQRVGIARALATGPRLVVADEPVTALDASVQASILGLLDELRRELGLTLLLISHDLALVERVSDRVGVMYLGRLVEEAPSGELFADPRHPYSAALLSAVPVPEPGSSRRRIVLTGEPPSSGDPPTGCAFHPRCPVASARCAREAPSLSGIAPGRVVACHHPGELVLDGSANPPS